MSAVQQCSQENDGGLEKCATVHTASSSPASGTETPGEDVYVDDDSGESVSITSLSNPEDYFPIGWKRRSLVALSGLTHVVAAGLVLWRVVPLFLADNQEDLSVREDLFRNLYVTLILATILEGVADLVLVAATVCTGVGLWWDTGLKLAADVLLGLGAAREADALGSDVDLDIADLAKLALRLVPLLAPVVGQRFLDFAVSCSLCFGKIEKQEKESIAHVKYMWLSLEKYRCSFLYVMYAAAVVGEALSIAIPVIVSTFVVLTPVAGYSELNTVQKVAGYMAAAGVFCIGIPAIQYVSCRGYKNEWQLGCTSFLREETWFELLTVILVTIPTAMYATAVLAGAVFIAGAVVLGVEQLALLILGIITFN